MERVLIVEDEPGISSFMQLELEHEGYEAVVVSDGRAALTACETARWDVVLLDVLLPELNGLEVLRRIRKVSRVPVIMVTARSETYDRVAGLDTGADDYIIKPFAIEELLARIRSVLRRSSHGDDAAQTMFSAEMGTVITIGDVVLDTKACTVTVAQQPVTLTKTEYLLLHCFMTHPDEVLSREKIIDAVWGISHYIDASAVDVYVRYIRAKIDAPGNPSHITTVRGIGYVMKTPPLG
ncbi:MAG: response regulator transcription factor [Treponema sp.]|nr:response regulator transcription factor [Treponema sp.]